MLKTVIENRQHLIIEGCCIPFDWKRDFEHGYLEHIRYFCLVMSEKYIRNNLALRGYLWVRLSSHHRMVGMMDELNWYSCPRKSHMISQIFRISKSITLADY